jgi:hypothetical protein
MVPPLVGLRQRLDDDKVLTLLREGRASMPAFPALLADAAQSRELLDFLMRRNQPLSKAVPANRQAPGYFAVGYRFINDPDGYPAASRHGAGSIASISTPASSCGGCRWANTRS